MTTIQINNNPEQAGCEVCAFKKDYCERMRRNLRSQQSDRYRCVMPTAHGGVYVKESGALMVRLCFTPQEAGRAAKLMEESALVEDYIFNLLNPHV